MMTVAEWKQTLKAGKLDKKLKQLYGDDADMLVHQKKRYAAALDEFAKLYPQRKQVGIFSAPGRTEVGGNHTDHQHGCVLAAAVNLDVIAVVGFHQEDVIRLKSMGYSQIQVQLSDLSKKPEEESTSTALIRGIAAKLQIWVYPSAAGTLTPLRRCSAAAGCPPRRRLRCWWEQSSTSMTTAEKPVQ